MRPGHDYNPALQNLQCLILGLMDLTLHLLAPKTNQHFLVFCLLSTQSDGYKLNISELHKLLLRKSN